MTPPSPALGSVPRLAYAELEISLNRWPTGSFTIDLRYSQPDSDADVALLPDGPRFVRFDFAGLLARVLDPQAYGLLLGQSLLADPAVKAELGKAYSSAQSSDVPLRLRLKIEPSATELHSLRWETLRDPDTSAPLLTGERLLFSRHLSSYDWQPVRLRPRGELKALVVIANPSDIGGFQVERRPYGIPDQSGAGMPARTVRLEPVDVPGEEERARASLADIRIDVLASGGMATLTRLVERLRPGYDILYLICHGALMEGEPWLYLEDESGRTAPTPGSQLVSAVSDLQQRPRLVVLASCQSGGPDSSASDEGVLAAIGPRLAAAGVPAVLAMQGNVTMATAARFLPAFFAQLAAHGQIDRAVAAARFGVAERPDSWMPVLFMRHKSGRIWSAPGVATERPAFEQWRPLLRYIDDGDCTPILGPGLAEAVLGSSREIARKWAEECELPFAPDDWEEFPRVAQYRAVTEAPDIPGREYLRALRENLQRLHRDRLDEDLLGERVPVEQLISAIGAKIRERDPTDPHTILAGLDLPVYVTTRPDNLLADALRALGKKPVIEHCRWDGRPRRGGSALDEDSSYVPSPEEPLVFQLFGRLEDRRSLILTEDNYFDFLINVSKNEDLIPVEVRAALTDRALLFLGFHVDDWAFRVLFRRILAFGGKASLSYYTHVAVQIDPEETRILDLEGVRRYLTRYFEDDKITIYWGSAADFLRELQARRR
jgi:hypothetical protein